MNMNDFRSIIKEGKNKNKRFTLECVFNNNENRKTKQNILVLAKTEEDAYSKAVGYANKHDLSLDHAKLLNIEVI